MAKEKTNNPQDLGYAAGMTKAAAWMTSLTILNKLAVVVVGLLLARILSPAEYGIALFAVNFSTFLLILPPQVMGDILIAEGRSFDRIAGAANRVVWIAALAMFLIQTLVSIPFEIIDGREGLALLIIVAAIRPLADAFLSLASARVRLDLDYRRISLVDGSVVFATTIGSLLMALLGAGPLALILPPIVALALRGALYWRSVYKFVDLTFRHDEVRNIARRFWVGGFGQYINNVVLSLEIVVLGLATNARETGLFALAASLAVQANNIIAGQIAALLQPVFARVHSDPRRQIDGFLRATRLIAAIAVPLSLVQATIAVPLFALLFESKWVGAIAIFSILSVAQSFIFVAAPAASLVKAQGRFRDYFFFKSLQLCISLLFFLVAINLGEEGALAVAAMVELPTDPTASRALALGFASALVWITFSPAAVWMAGRPAGLTFWGSLRLFLEPWLIALPVVGLLHWLWISLMAHLPETIAHLITVGLLAPLACIIASTACLCARKGTRHDVTLAVRQFGIR